jgi:hypothetical protein
VQRFRLILILVAAMAAPLLFAASAGSIRGKVVGADDKPLSGVPVVLRNDVTGFRQQTTTAADGSFAFFNIPRAMNGAKAGIGSLVKPHGLACRVGGLACRRRALACRRRALACRRRAPACRRQAPACRRRAPACRRQAPACRCQAPACRCRAPACHRQALACRRQALACRCQANLPKPNGFRHRQRTRYLSIRCLSPVLWCSERSLY